MQKEWEYRFLFGAGENPLLIVIVPINIARRGFVCSVAPVVMQSGYKEWHPTLTEGGIDNCKVTLTVPKRALVSIPDAYKEGSGTLIINTLDNCYWCI